MADPTLIDGRGVAGGAAQPVVVMNQSPPGNGATAANQVRSATPYYNAALLATKQAVKASAGSLAAYHIYNPNASDMFVQMWDLAAANVTVGTTAPTWVLWVPAGGALDAALPEPITFATALTIAATTTASGNTAPGTGLMVNLFYN